MMELLKFTFESGTHFVGVAVLLAFILLGLVGMCDGLGRMGQTTHYHSNEDEGNE